MTHRTATTIMAAYACLGLLAAACSASDDGGWTAARPIPGAPIAESTYLNGDVITKSFSCASAGDCALAFSGPRSTVWVVSEQAGTWRAPHRIPGLNGSVLLSCSAPGACAVVGDRTDIGEARVAIEVNGNWRRAQPVPGLAALSHGGASEIVALSCGAGGWCAVTGEYTSAGASLSGEARHPVTPFVATEHDGTWEGAQQIPGLAALTPRGWSSFVRAISCGRDGWCAASGSYRDGLKGGILPFVVSGRDGRWRRVQALPAPAGQMTSISCTTTGNCSAAGPGIRPVVVTDRYGLWGKPQVLPGISLGTKFVSATVADLQCTAPGECVLAGFYGATSEDCGGEYNFCYLSNYSGTVPFIARQVGGVWRAAREIPDLTALNRGGIALITSVSCASQGNCAVGGLTTGLGESAAVRGFVAAEIGGVWSEPERVPGLSAFGSVGSEVDYAFCGHAGGCVAIGTFGTRVGPGSQWRRHLFATVSG